MMENFREEKDLDSENTFLKMTTHHMRGIGKMMRNMDLVNKGFQMAHSFLGTGKRDGLSLEP